MLTNKILFPTFAKTSTPVSHQCVLQVQKSGALGLGETQLRNRFCGRIRVQSESSQHFEEPNFEQTTSLDRRDEEANNLSKNGVASSGPQKITTYIFPKQPRLHLIFSQLCNLGFNNHSLPDERDESQHLSWEWRKNLSNSTKILAQRIHGTGISTIYLYVVDVLW